MFLSLIAAATCPDTLFHNQGIVDSTFLIKAVDNVTSTDVCCALCADTPKCTAWTLQDQGAKQCRMTNCPMKHKASNVVSGLSNRPVDPACQPTPAPTAPPVPPPFPDYCTTGAGKGKCRNVLYFIADDMRADWGTYGLPTKTPNLDALATEGLLFDHAYCQISVCAPSRMSFMTSRRPDRSGIWNFIDTVTKDTQACPGHFKDHGYITLGLGKGFHQAGGAWNADKYWSLEDKPYYPYVAGKCPHGGQGGGHCVQKDEEIYDYNLRVKTVEYLQYAANKSKATGRPFFVQCGFRKPHAPWQAPQRMYDLYTDSAVQTATFDTLDESTPLIAWSKQLTVALENGTSFPYAYDEAVPKWVQQDQRHAYYASISYVDEHVGAILQTLKDEKMDDSTLVLFHSDHGYSMGEHGYWEKKSNFDLTVKVPLLIKAPWLSDTSAGKRTDALVDLVDVMPTVISLAGLPPSPTGTDGVDVSALMTDPASQPKSGAPWHSAAFHQYPACGCKIAAGDPDGKACFNSTRQACNNADKHTFNHMGYSMRSGPPDAFRYTAWFRWMNETLEPNFNGSFAAELYSHGNASAPDDSHDMDSFENKNLAGRPEFAAQEELMHRALVDFFVQDRAGHAEERGAREGRERAALAAGAPPATADTSDPYDN